MKRLSQTVESHGRRYRKRLDQDLQQTDLSRKETEVFLRRLDNIFEQLPKARRQVHERIIGRTAQPAGGEKNRLYGSESDKLLIFWTEDASNQSEQILLRLPGATKASLID